ncbi:MAG TPA: NADP-dependent oxidoreductase [Steroidobacteraceae bacterium]
MKLPVFLAAAALSLAGSALASNMIRAVIAVDQKIEIQNVPKPEPQAGQVRVRVHSVSVNPVDWKLVDWARPGTRQIPGRDFSGVIDAVGPSAGDWKVGDEVVGITVGSYAEYVLANVKSIARKPKNVSFDEAAGIGVVGETAWRAIVTVGDVKPGQRVLIHGGAGGVGSSAVQIAKARGAHVIATASARNHDFLRSLGAAEVIDYNTTKFEEKVKDIDMVLNTVDRETGMRSMSIIKSGGILVSIVGPMPAEACAAAKIRCAETGRANGELLSNVVELAEAGQFRVSIEQRLTLADTEKAWESNRKGHTRGKIILRVMPHQPMP